MKKLLAIVCMVGLMLMAPGCCCWRKNRCCEPRRECKPVCCKEKCVREPRKCKPVCKKRVCCPKRDKCCRKSRVRKVVEEEPVVEVDEVVE